LKGEKKMAKIPKKLADHPVGWISGVTPDDTQLEAGRKAIEMMKAAGFSKRAIDEAERMYEAAKRRGIK
jgi:hypothetical protein